ncbi:matrix-remodeling-associated protein 5 [Trichomycterus rosablanca]|uniref:matrix-remodeling-associated protein 5 n=1 Tax=Trichomycterus rosablanca TaxID=2290929 RepID=UPI002F35EE16
MMELNEQMMKRCVKCMLTLLALGVLLRNVNGCPHPCACPQPGEIHCTFRSLLNVPASLPRQVERLNLGFNTINRITESTFAGMRKLELLMMHGNNIHNIPKGAFQDLISLQMMKMSYNKLKVISRHTFQGLWSLARLHLDHNHLEFIHPDAFQGLTSLRLLQLEGNRLQQLHAATFATLSILGYFPMSTLRHLYLSENGLTALPQKMLAGMPYLENLFLHENPWTCDCRMKWFNEWDSNAPGVLKCKKDKVSQLCPVCVTPKQLKKTDLRELEKLKCTSPVISAPHRTSAPNTESELLTLADFQQPFGNVSLDLSDEHGNQVDLNCHVNDPTESTRINWDHSNPNQINANVTLTLDLECSIDRSNYERLWRLIAYYSDVPAHLKREIMLSKEPQISYRYRQDVEVDAVYFTGVKANIVAEPAWIMQSTVNLRLNRPQSSSKQVKLILSTNLSQLLESETERQQSRNWVMIETKNTTRTLQTVVIGSRVQMNCNVHSSGNPSIKWMLPNGAKVEAPYQSTDNRISVSQSGLLAITAVDYSDSGVYYCIAQVMGDISVLPFRLTVEESSSPGPGDEGVAEPMSGVAGRPVSIPCVTSGSPDPDINWILPDNRIINTWSKSSRMSLASNGTLTIRYSQLVDSGYYKCVAESQHGVDRLATKVTLTRLSGGQPLRKYSSRPQPAERASTKIIPLTENGLEASGDNENAEPEEKTPSVRVDTFNKRIPNVVRGGHPSRKVWRHPSMPRRRITPPGVNRNNSVDPRRRVNTLNGQIDPERWADILAKVRKGGSSSKTTTTPSLVQSQLLEFTTAKQSEALERTEESSPDITTTKAPMHEASYPVTVSEASIKTTVESLDIKSLDSKDQMHITYQIAAPETNQDLDLFTTTINAVQTTTGPQPTSYSVMDRNVAKWDSVNYVESTTSYEAFILRNQSHTSVNKVTDASQTSEGDDNHNISDEYSLLKSSSHVVGLDQEKSTHSPVLTTVVAFNGQTAEKQSTPHLFTDTSESATRAHQETSKIPLFITVAPRTKPSDRETHTTLIYIAPPLRTRNSSSSRRKNGGRRKRPDRIRTKQNSYKSAHVTSTTSQPTTLAPVSEIAKMTASSESKIKTSTWATSSGAQVNTTAPFTDSQATSLSEMNHKKNTELLYTGQSNLSLDPFLNKKEPEIEHTTLSHAKLLNISTSTAVVSVSPSTSPGFTGQEKSRTDGQTVSTLSPLIQNTPATSADQEGFTSIRPTVDKPFEDPQRKRVTGYLLKSDKSPETPHSLLEIIPGGGRDEVKKPHNISEPENVSASEGLVGEFSTRPYSSSAANTEHEIIASHDSEFPSGSTKANLYKGAQEDSQVTTERPITSQSAQSGTATTTKLSSASEDKENGYPLRKPGFTEANVSLMEGDFYFTTLKTTTSTVTSTTTIKPATATIKPSTTTPPTIQATPKTIKTSKIYTYVPFQNIPNWGRKGVPDSLNHIPDRHQDRILTTERNIKPSFPHSTSLSEYTKLEQTTTRPKSQTTLLKAPTTAQKFPMVHSPGLTTPLKSNGNSSTVHSTAVSNSHYNQQLPVVPGRRGQPRITSTDIKTVAAQAESDAHLDCVAAGEPSPFFSWTKVSTGASIAQNTKIQRYEVHSNGTLIIRKVHPLDRGQYLCKAQNQYGEDKMVVNLIVLARHPRVLEPRYRDTTTHLGDPVELECRSQGHPLPRTTWLLPNRAALHNDAPSAGTPEQRGSVLASSTPDQRILVLSNGTLRITSATYTDRGVYKCIASNAVGADSISVRLTVTSTPPIIQQPRQEDLTLSEGSTAYLNCTAKGSPSPTISWSTPKGLQLRPSEFVTGHNSFVFPNGTLIIRGLSQAETGKYECTATSTVGSSSRILRLTVKKSIASARARITSSSPQKTDVVYGGKLQLDCVASGDPEPRVIWKTPSKKLVDANYSYDPRIKVFANGTLRIHSVTEKDEGDYLCAAHNKAGDDYILLKVTILTKPAKIEQRTQADQKVMYGGNLKVDCVASGLPNPMIQWALPDGTMINSIMKSGTSNGPRHKYVVFDNGTLFFNEVGMHEEGDYTCYAENRIGKDEMKVHVKVLADVLVIKNKTYEVVRVMYGESASLKCTAKGDPNPHILWFSPINRAIPSASSKYLIHNDGTLVIQNAQRFDGGNYTCLARNSAGQDRKVTKLEILVSPPTINGLSSSTNYLKVSGVKDQRKLIHCKATGTPVPLVMWVLPENIILPAPYYGSRMTVYQNGTLDIHSLKITNGAKLTCIARNEGGEAMLVVQLDLIDLLEKPRLRSPKTESQSITVGRMMILNCSIEGPTSPQLTWVLPSGDQLISGTKFNKFYHKPDGTLVISNPALSETGTYRCLGRNSGGVVERTVVLTPGRKPDISNRYNSPVSVINGESLQLHCLSGSEPVRLTWTLPSGVVLNRPQRAGRYAVLPNGTLNIQQASVYDRGSYTCRAANEYGSSLQTVSVAIIAYSPRISSGPALSTYAKRGVAVQLNCAATGIPKPEVAWEIPDRTRLIVSSQPRVFGNKYLHPQGFLIIQNPTPKDTGLYKCTARNVIGVDSKGTYLNVY